VNQWMLDLLGADPNHYEGSSIETPASLVALATGGFKEVDDCVVPADYPESSIWSAERPKVTNIDDETGFECSISEIHIEGHFDVPIEFEELVRTGKDVAFYFGSELSKSEIEGSFRVIVSAKRADSECNVGDACVVRYHKLRAGQVWLDDNLEAYKEEAIAVLDFLHD
jgi:hypothetical protein